MCLGRTAVSGLTRLGIGSGAGDEIQTRLGCFLSGVGLVVVGLEDHILDLAILVVFDDAGRRLFCLEVFDSFGLLDMGMGLGRAQGRGMNRIGQHTFVDALRMNRRVG